MKMLLQRSDRVIFRIDDFTAIGVLFAENDFKKGSFPRAVSSYETNAFALGHVKTYAFKQELSPEAFRELICLDHGVVPAGVSFSAGGDPEPSSGTASPAGGSGGASFSR